MVIYISGGAKNGKSTFAENLIDEYSKGREKYYLATMIPHDEEDLIRIKRHRDERKDKGYITIEEGYSLSELDLPSSGIYLLDSVTALLSNVMFRDGNIYPDSGRDVARDLLNLIGKVEDIVMVSDYIYQDYMDYDTYTEKYMENLSYVDRTISKAADKVYEVSFGNIKEFK